MAAQQEMKFRTWGGKRKGAGRKHAPGVRRDRFVRKRPPLSSRHPVHVVLQVTKEVGRLRRRSTYHALRRALQVTHSHDGFRIVHISIQSNHVHLVVEAEHEKKLSRGMLAFQVSAARRLNAALSHDRKLPKPRRGKVFLRRYHAVAITTPRQVHNTMSYVLNNWRRHREDLEGHRQRSATLDPYSSAIAFTGWRGRTTPFAIPDGYEPLPVLRPESWLLREGWQRYGPLDPRATPGDMMNA